MIMRILSSRRFIWFVSALLILQATWIALSGVYPMAFDEDFHLGIIGLYTNHLSPFWSAQPQGADVFGVVFRDPSFLYHYLLSFILRLVSFFTSSIYAQVVILRLINVAFFSVGIYVFWILLQKFNASLKIVNSVLLFFVLIPVVPLLAAQINYDNLLFPLVGITFILTIDLVKQFSKAKVKIKTIYFLLITCLVASLVKYAFLPILLTVFAIILATIYQRRKKLQVIYKNLLVQLKKVNKITLTVLALLLLLISVIFTERYAINIARYHRPAPECTKALSIASCSSYGPWLRDYNFSNTKGEVDASPIKYSHKWLRGMWSRLYFAVDGPKTNFQTRGPLFFPAVSAIVLFVIGIAALLLKLPAVWKKYDKTAIIVTSTSFAVYIISLWQEQYKAYLKTGQPVAINGRYLIPVLLPIMLIAALSISQLFGRRVFLKKSLLILSILAIAYGGGALTYILRGSAQWYWPNSPVSSINLTIKRNLGPYIYGFNRQNQFMP